MFVAHKPSLKFILNSLIGIVAALCLVFGFTPNSMAQESLTVEDVKRVISQAIQESQAQGVGASIAGNEKFWSLSV